MIENARWSWVAQRFARRLVRPLRSRLYHDADRDVRKAILVAGTARSGTTWVGDLLASGGKCRMMFEPFHCGKVEEYGTYNYFQYLSPDAEDAKLRSFCERVFSGAMRHPWIDREVRQLLPSCRVIKEIRANLLLGWIHRNFPRVPIVLVLRHPCAVASSRMRLGWATDADIEPMLRQPALVEEFLGDKMGVIRSARTVAAKHAVIWCVHNLVPLKLLQDNEITVVRYESLCDDPETEIPRLFAGTGREATPAIFRRAMQPSSTAKANSAVVRGRDRAGAWRQNLTAAEIRQVIEVMDGFGLSAVYPEDLQLAAGDR